MMDKNKIRPCPNCGKSGEEMGIMRVMFSGSIFDKHLYFVECPSCHWCGRTRFMLRRAIRSWNKEKRRA